MTHPVLAFALLIAVVFFVAIADGALWALGAAIVAVLFFLLGFHTRDAHT